jgi:tol-pal system protein YbgF
VTRLIAVSALLLLSGPVFSGPALAQAVDVGKLDRRVGTLESEMRAVQRKVFPGGNGRFFEPEVPAQAATPAPAPEAAPATSPIADLTGRVDALEGQLRTMTGQIEALEYKLRALEDGQRRLKGDVEFRLNTLENPGGVPAAGAAPAEGAVGTGTAPVPALPAPKPVAAKPATADAAWTAAFAKVTAKDWPSAEAAMTGFIADWPKSTRLPQARYWLGRSLAQRAQHAAAAKAFLEVYQTAPRAAAAPDALVGLANSLNAMAKPAEACQVLGELESVYGAKLTDTQKADALRQRTKAKCTA